MRFGAASLAVACASAGAEAIAAAPAFDCGLAADRIAVSLKEIGRDASDYDALQAETAAQRTKTWASERELLDLNAKRQMLVFIRKTVSSRVIVLLKDVGQARAHACLTDEQVAEIRERATVRTKTVFDEQS